MGKAVLLLLLAVVVSSTFLSLNQSALQQATNRTHSEAQAQSFARNYAETARSSVASAMIGLENFRSEEDVLNAIGMDGGRAVAYGGGHYALSDYTFLDATQRLLTFSVTGQAYHTRRAAADGAEQWAFARHTIQSTYEMALPDVSCFPLAGSHMALDLAGGTNGTSTIECPEDYEPLVNAARHHDYNVNDAFGDVDGMLTDLKNEIDATNGNKGNGTDTTSLNAGLDDRGVPLGDDISEALAGVDWGLSRNVVFSGDHTTSGNENYGYNPMQPHVVHIQKTPSQKGSLTIASGDRFRGSGLLLIEGDLTVLGRLEWKGIVYIRSSHDLLQVNLNDAEEVDIDGAFLVDHDAPPAGGHMDLTIVHQLDGTWETPATTPGQRGWGNGWPWTLHRHRYNHDEPGENGRGSARVVFRDGDVPIGTNGAEHEAYTGFHSLLQYLGDDEIYLQLENAEHTGASLINFWVNGTDCSGSVRAGFDPDCQAPDNAHRSRPFQASQLDSLRLDVRSLRLLSRHVDREPLNDPDGEVSGCNDPYTDDLQLQTNGAGQCVAYDRPRAVAGLYSRDGALSLQVRRANGDSLLYEAMAYWHSKHANHSQYLQEVAEQQEWLDNLAAGGFYGMEIDGATDNFRLTMDMDLVRATTDYLGIDTDPMIRHIRTVSYADASHNETDQECDAYDNGIGNGLDCAPGNSGTTPGGGGGVPGPGGNNGGGNGIDDAPGNSGNTFGDDADGSNTLGTTNTGGRGQVRR